MVTLNSIAELRRAKETAEIFDSLQPDEQAGWLEYLLESDPFCGRNQPDAVRLPARYRSKSRPSSTCPRARSRVTSIPSNPIGVPTMMTATGRRWQEWP